MAAASLAFVALHTGIPFSTTYESFTALFVLTEFVMGLLDTGIRTQET